MNKLMIAATALVVPVTVWLNRVPRCWKTFATLCALFALTMVPTFAQTNTDPTSIYSTALADYQAALGIAIFAIGIGAAVFFIRKGLKARM